MNVPGLAAALSAAPLVALAFVGTACSPSQVSQPCMPPPFSVSAGTAKPGGTLTVTAEDATCNPSYGEKAQVQVTLTDSSGTQILKELAPMHDQGGFSFELGIPVTAASGAAAVEAYPYNLDWCDDTGRNNRVGRGETGTTIERASCAPRIQKVLIEP